MEEKTEGERRRGRKRKQLPDDLNKKTRYWNMKEDALNCYHTLWRTSLEEAT